MELAELRDYIAQTNLALIGANETLTSEDARLIEDVIAISQGELEQLEIATWSLDDVPMWACAAFGQLVQAKINAFGFPADPQLESYAVRKLRYLTADSRFGTGTADYF